MYLVRRGNVLNTWLREVKREPINSDGKSIRVEHYYKNCKSATRGGNAPKTDFDR